MPEGMEINTVLSCQINAEYLTTPIDVQMIVRNLSEKKPYGIGCEFLDLTNDEKDSIEEFVDSYLHSKRETDKVA
jgi:Tfp pilus assembly protein PilZ